MTQILLTGGLANLQERDEEVARDARIIMEKLGPTYVKAGQMMSVRPDIIGQRAMTELAKLQDSVPRFDSAVARQANALPPFQPAPPAMAVSRRPRRTAAAAFP